MLGLALAATLALAALDIEETAAAPASRTLPGYLTCMTRGATVTVGGSTTSLYKVVPNHVTCAFANPWVSRLSDKQGAAFSGALTGGPSGWHCFASEAGKRAASGSCTDNTGAKSFSWSPSFTETPTVTPCMAKGAAVDGSPGTANYTISLEGVTCAFAKPWVTRLSYKRVVLTYKTYSNGTRQAYGVLRGGPPGWVCGSTTSLIGKRARVGGCDWKSGNRFKRFNWTRGG